MMKIEILGAGCPKCEQLVKNAKAAIEEMGIEAEVKKVTDIIEIANRGVMMTPALSVNGEIKMVGKVATVDQLKSLLAA